MMGGCHNHGVLLPLENYKVDSATNFVILFQNLQKRYVYVQGACYFQSILHTIDDDPNS